MDGDGDPDVFRSLDHLANDRVKAIIAANEGRAATAYLARAPGSNESVAPARMTALGQPKAPAALRDNLL